MFEKSLEKQNECPSSPDCKGNPDLAETELSMYFHIFFARADCTGKRDWF